MRPNRRGCSYPRQLHHHNGSHNKNYEQPTIPLWPAGSVPGALGNDPARDVPTLTPYALSAKAGSSRGAIVVCPGGGYGALADHEGEPVARWLNTLG
jgi:hypothetical protein